MRQQHNVVIRASWGSLPLVSQHLWTRLGCDALLLGDGSRPPAAQAALASGIGPDAQTAFLTAYKAQHDSAMRQRRLDPARRLSRGSSSADSASGRVVLAVCACTTSRGFRPQRLGQLTLFRLMLPSLIRTLSSREAVPDAAAGGTLELWLYVAYDVGDAFYDSPSREAELRAWLDMHMVAPLAAAGVTARHALLRYQNNYRKPGPAFNFMMAAAAEDGADYLYRVNDDTEFVGGGWLVAAVSSLRGYSPPNVGVVGPVCREGNTKILTHDLVHRTHLHIFEYYYPPIFLDWWMDDWISTVYGPARTTHGPFLVRHHVGVHGTRYDIDQSHERYLALEVESGRRALQRWLAQRAA